MNKTVYFYDGKKINRFMGFGQMTTLAQACYFRAKELGYKRVVCEWHNMVAYSWNNKGWYKGLLNISSHGILPIIFVSKGTKGIRNSDMIDLSEPDSLFEGCPPIMSNKITMVPMFDYLNKYYRNTGIRPTFNIPKDTDNPYILFHYRKSEQDRQKYRNTPLPEWKCLLKLFKDKYGKKFKFKKIGEISPLDNEFDEVIDYFNDDVQGLFKLVNNASLYVGSAAGPLALTYMLNIPTILFIDKKTNKNYEGDLYDWLDKDRIMFIHGDYYIINDDDVLKFVNKFISEK